MYKKYEEAKQKKVFFLFFINKREAKNLGAQFFPHI